jgi:hypothetical protein
LNNTNEKEADELIKKATRMSAPRTFELLEHTVLSFMKKEKISKNDRIRLKAALKETKDEIKKLKRMRKIASLKKSSEKKR